jgi:hypothetical protein
VAQGGFKFDAVGHNGSLLDVPDQQFHHLKTGRLAFQIKTSLSLSFPLNNEKRGVD